MGRKSWPAPLGMTRVGSGKEDGELPFDAPFGAHHTQLNTGVVHSRNDFLGFRVFRKKFVLGLFD
jgi:hypothetical protein